MEEYKKIGKLTKGHGLSGEISLRVDEEYKKDLFKTEKIYIEHHGYKVPYFIDYIKKEKPIRIKIEDISNIEEAHVLSNQNIYLSNQDIDFEVEKDDGLVYRALVGINIIDTNGEFIAEIIDILSYPQQEMALINFKGKEQLIPINESFIVKINLDRKTIVLDLPEGILEL